MSYDPTTISETDTLAVISRIDRYINRHGSEYGETPVPGMDKEESRAVILADWLSADWEAQEWTYLQRNGRTLFSPDMSDFGKHLRAVLFMAGRARKRGWVESGPMRRAARAEARRRDMDDSVGAGMASRAADPARIVSAVEEAQRGGIRVTPVDEQGKRLRWVKTKNSQRTIVAITRRPAATLHEDGRVDFGQGESTGIQFERVTVYNFRRVGSIPARELPKTTKRIPAGTTADTLREALVG